jgi:acetoin utilization protein AcuB
MPKVREYMTACPHTVGSDQTVAFAHTLLYQHRIRQLPVLDGGQLVGVLSERDLTLLASLRDLDPHTLKIEEVMSVSIYKVSPDTPLDQVVSEMAAKKYGSAIVVENNSVVGIFTTIDVCSTLGTLLKERYSS